jgi:hypothetical protein
MDWFGRCGQALRAEEDPRIGFEIGIMIEEEKLESIQN